MQIQNNIDLKSYNTFQVKSVAKYFVQIQSAQDILQLIESPIYQENKTFFLGAGANTIFVNDFDGLVIKIDILWKEILSQNDDEVIIKVGAWENRHDFVLRCAQNNFVGMENLAYIPSNIWATAVQNIWAYWTEAKDIIQTVYGVNLQTKEIQTLQNNECHFGYRESIFKNELKNKFIITHVIFKLQKYNPDYKFNCEYSGINQKINELWFDLEDIKASDFVQVITQIRKDKLPDREKIWTAGSFFKNPVITNEQREVLQKNFPELKWFVVDGWIKLSAWQLIDMCGFKWQSDGKVWTYKNHALILVNEWDANGQDIKNFANQIQTKIQEKFGIFLDPEAIFVE